jgi:hypothetical protein
MWLNIAGPFSKFNHLVELFFWSLVVKQPCFIVLAAGQSRPSFGCLPDLRSPKEGAERREAHF